MVIDEPTWKQIIARDLTTINKSSEVLSLFFAQAATTVGIEVRTENLKLNEKLYEKELAISELQESIEDLKKKEEDQMYEFGK